MGQLKEKNLSRHTIELEDAKGEPMTLVLKKITPRMDDLYRAEMERQTAERKALKKDFPTYFRFFDMPDDTEAEKTAKNEHFAKKRKAILEEAERMEAVTHTVKKRQLFETIAFIVDREASGLSEEDQKATIDNWEWFLDSDLDAMRIARDRFRDALGRF